MRTSNQEVIEPSEVVRLHLRAMLVCCYNTSDLSGAEIQDWLATWALLGLNFWMFVGAGPYRGATGSRDAWCAFLPVRLLKFDCERKKGHSASEGEKERELGDFLQ